MMTINIIYATWSNIGLHNLSDFERVAALIQSLEEILAKIRTYNYPETIVEKADELSRRVGVLKTTITENGRKRAYLDANRAVDELAKVMKEELPQWPFSAL
ncbi:hypothetical protein ONV78_17955 [Hahella sp. CR1]|uniref:hypothetical protein n=1 Tax=Hahella sp. CR1 TaxID=2992807 RepID=UPI002442E9A4|nr:hypothetical protein [Hahella sp. CR1]MDG9669626.1 hypothetical protein [Hahella sp. CR1]